MPTLEDTLRTCCEDHLRVAALYERGGNSSGARQLRAVANLLGVILQGGTPVTVLPPPTKEDMMTDERTDPDEDDRLADEIAAELEADDLGPDYDPEDPIPDYEELGAGDA